MTTSSSAKAGERSARPDPELKLLDVFVGEWKMEGQQHEGPFGPATNLSARETYEWLSGEFFLIHRLTGRLGDAEMACIEVIGYDAASQSYPIQSFYNDGNAKEWRDHEHDGVWTLTGDWEKDGQTTKVRRTALFSDDRNSIAGKWEYSSDGSNWKTFWDVMATKVK